MDELLLLCVEDRLVRLRWVDFLRQLNCIRLLPWALMWHLKCMIHLFQLVLKTLLLTLKLNYLVFERLNGILVRDRLFAKSFQVRTRFVPLWQGLFEFFLSLLIESLLHRVLGWRLHRWQLTRVRVYHSLTIRNAIGVFILCCGRCCRASDCMNSASHLVYLHAESLGRRFQLLDLCVPFRGGRLLLQLNRLSIWCGSFMLRW